MSDTVKPNQLWKSNDDSAPRTVRVVTTDCRWAEVRNTDTGRVSRIDLSRFTRKGRTGWTYVGEADTPLPAEPTVQVGQIYQDRYEERHGRTRYLRVASAGSSRARCISWYENSSTHDRETNLAFTTLLGPGYRLVSEPDGGA
jgi:hypothetical protein